eukprot:CAMPEP_0201707312 /NCGR_PEP_ID=MMETSP0578-20130828/51371_1 /ASSEMBLY_ACC=CAM_ASM_000663 /TAXON_ID=267565 /ORGANISM="Skeletonema grethea, Strain CCMP 1804" /LENGTH=261 /DNA_ID=CAMNT_0048195905 /DNA_START=1 /DNA_END=786 /DNA_ORIENTATION=+
MEEMIVSMMVSSTEKVSIPWKKWAFELWNGEGKINYNEYVGDKWTHTWTNAVEFDGKLWFKSGYGEGNMKYIDGSEYSGKLLDGKRHGKGIQTWANGDVVFDGEWWIDKLHGEYSVSVSSEYRGEWVADMRDGEGKMKYKDGSEYIGKWRHGKRHGNGILKGADGKVIFDGEWTANYPMSKDDLSSMEEELNSILLRLAILLVLAVAILVVFLIDLTFRHYKFWILLGILYYGAGRCCKLGCGWGDGSSTNVANSDAMVAI